MSAADIAPTLGQPGWSRRQWVWLIVAAAAAHLALLFIFATKKPVVPRALTHVPQLQLVTAADDLIALTDPTLFLLPHANDFSTAIWQTPLDTAPPPVRWTEAPQWLEPAAGQLGGALRELLPTDGFAAPMPACKPEPDWPEVAADFAVATPNATTLQITGELAQRRWTSPLPLPSLSCNDALAPSRVQALVDPAGNILSVILLESSALPEADQRALTLARQLHFSAAAQASLGEISFYWHTVPAATP